MENYRDGVEQADRGCTAVGWDEKVECQTRRNLVTVINSPVDLFGTTVVER